MHPVLVHSDPSTDHVLDTAAAHDLLTTVTVGSRQSYYTMYFWIMHHARQDVCTSAARRVASQQERVHIKVHQAEHVASQLASELQGYGTMRFVALACMYVQQHVLLCLPTCSIFSATLSILHHFNTCAPFVAHQNPLPLCRYVDRVQEARAALEPAAGIVERLEDLQIRTRRAEAQADALRRLLAEERGGGHGL